MFATVFEERVPCRHGDVVRDRDLAIGAPDQETIAAEPDRFAVFAAIVDHVQERERPAQDWPIRLRFGERGAALVRHCERRRGGGLAVPQQLRPTVERFEQRGRSVGVGGVMVVGAVHGHVVQAPRRRLASSLRGLSTQPKRRRTTVTTGKVAVRSRSVRKRWRPQAARRASSLIRHANGGMVGRRAGTGAARRPGNDGP